MTCCLEGDPVQEAWVEGPNLQLKVLLLSLPGSGQPIRRAQGHGHWGAPCEGLHHPCAQPDLLDGIFPAGFKQIPGHNICVKLPFMIF